MSLLVGNLTDQQQVQCMRLTLVFLMITKSIRSVCRCTMQKCFAIVRTSRDLSSESVRVKQRKAMEISDKKGEIARIMVALTECPKGHFL